MEDSDDEKLQIFVFENATEVNFDEYLNKDELLDEQNENKNEEVSKYLGQEEQYIDEIEDLDLDAQVKKATKDNKIFMKYDYTHEKPWINHLDKSPWFNYGFNEKSFKEWVQKHIDKRIEKQKLHQIENIDPYFNDNFKNNNYNRNIFTNYDELKKDNLINVIKKTNIKTYTNSKNNFYNKNELTNVEFNTTNENNNFDISSHKQQYYEDNNDNNYGDNNYNDNNYNDNNYSDNSYNVNYNYKNPYNILYNDKYKNKKINYKNNLSQYNRNNIYTKFQNNNIEGNNFKNNENFQKQNKPYENIITNDLKEFENLIKFFKENTEI